jgi:hypothetical protein
LGEACGDLVTSSGNTYNGGTHGGEGRSKGGVARSGDSGQTHGRDGYGQSHGSNVREEDHLQWSRELLIDSDEGTLKGIDGGLLLLPHEGNLVLVLMGSGGNDHDKSEVGHYHVARSGGGSRGGAHVNSQGRGMGCYRVSGCCWNGSVWPPEKDA